MKRHKAVLDITARTVHLESPTHDSVVLQLPSPTSTTSTLHHIAAQNLEDIFVACEFPYVFLEDLSGQYCTYLQTVIQDDTQGVS
jgi:hypothetical protein